MADASSKDRHTPLTQLVKTPAGFRVFDPTMVSARDQTFEDPSGKIVRGPTNAEVWLFLACGLLGGTGMALFLGESLLSGTLWFLLGAVLGFCLGAGISVCWDGLDRYQREHRGFEPEIDVGVDHPAQEVCALAAQIAETAAWRDRIVDGDRALPSIVWSAAAAVRDHDDDPDVGVELERTTANLRELLTVARDLDRNREHGPDPASHLRAGYARRLSDEIVERGRATRDLNGAGEQGHGPTAGGSAPP